MNVIRPHPIRGTKEIGSERIIIMAAEFRAVEGSSDERPILEITSTSEGEDRHGSRIFEWDTRVHMRTGQVLWQHDECPWLPQVAKKLSERKAGTRTVSMYEMLIELWRHIEQAHGNLPAFLYDAAQLHAMGTISRAFIPQKWKAREAETIPKEFAENVDYLLVEQTEESFVNVQSNRESVFARAVERARNSGRFSDALARTLGYEISPIILGGRRTMTTQAKPLAVGATVRFVADDGNKQHALISLCGFETDGTVIEMTADGERASVEFLAPHYSGMFSNIEAARVHVTTEAPPDWTLADYMTRSAASRHAPVTPAITDHAVSRMPLPRLRSIMTTAREALRCGGCYPEPMPYTSPYCGLCGRLLTEHDCDEELTGDAATAERQTIASMIDALAQQLDVALAGWDSAEHSALRDWCSMRVMDCMWSIDKMLRFLDYWYPDEQPADTPAVEADEVRKFIAAVESDTELKASLVAHRDAFAQSTRVGAELSAKNQARLRKIHVNADEIVQACADMLGMKVPDEAPADETERTTPFIRIKTSGSPSPSRDEGAGQAIRIVSASDAPVAAAGDRSTPAVQPDLYGHDTLSA